MTRKITIALALVAATVLGRSASAGQRAPGSPLCQVGQEDCEPRCITTSDGGPGRDNQYIDGRRSDGWRWRQTQMRRERFERFRAAQDEGRRHTSDMATGGSRIAGTNITVSPFVPGSTHLPRRLAGRMQAARPVRHRRPLLQHGLTDAADIPGWAVRPALDDDAP